MFNKLYEEFLLTTFILIIFIFSINSYAATPEGVWQSDKMQLTLQNDGRFIYTNGNTENCVVLGVWQYDEPKSKLTLSIDTYIHRAKGLYDGLLKDEWVVVNEVSTLKISDYTSVCTVTGLDSTNMTLSGNFYWIEFFLNSLTGISHVRPEVIKGVVMVRNILEPKRKDDESSFSFRKK